LNGNADKGKKISLITPLEILGFVGAVVLVLYLLFPEDKLLKDSQLKFYKQLEKENIFLSIKFLEEMNREFPEYTNFTVMKNLHSF